MTNIIDIKNKIDSGVIILVSSSAKIEHLKMLLNEINYKDLKVVHVSKLISEKEA